MSCSVIFGCTALQRLVRLSFSGIMTTCAAKADAAAWAAEGCVVAGAQTATTVSDLGAQSAASGYRSCNIRCPTAGGSFAVSAQQGSATCYHATLHRTTPPSTTENTTKHQTIPHCAMPNHTVPHCSTPCAVLCCVMPRPCKPRDRHYHMVCTIGTAGPCRRLWIARQSCIFHRDVMQSCVMCSAL